MTRRSKLLAFRGSYHGGFIIDGIPEPALNVPFDVVKCTFNDSDGTRAQIQVHGHTLAAAIVEPMMGVSGCIPATQEFLRMLREETERIGALLIFDEVMTSRLAPGGAQALYSIRPDVTTLGKFWGGGFNFGAFGGAKALMRHFDSFSGGRLYHAGTFNNNAIAMAAGLAGARDVYTPAACERLNRSGDVLRERLNGLRAGLDGLFHVTGMGAVMAIHWHDQRIKSPTDTEPGNSLKRQLFQLEMMLAGFYVAQRGLITLSLALTDANLEAFINAVDAYVASFHSVLASTR